MIKILHLGITAVSLPHMSLPHMSLLSLEVLVEKILMKRLFVVQEYHNNKKGRNISVKNMIYKRNAVIILVACVIISMFAGCGEKESPSATESASKSSTVTGAKTTSRSSVASGTKATGTAVVSGTAQTTSGTQAGGVQTGGTDGIEDAEDSVPGEDTSTTPTENVKTYNLQGRVIDMMSFSPAQLPKSASDGGTRIYDLQYRLMKEAEEKYNCKFNIVTVSNTTILESEVEKAFLAGVRYADAAMLYAQRIFPKY